MKWAHQLRFQNGPYVRYLRIVQENICYALNALQDFAGDGQPLDQWITSAESEIMYLAMEAGADAFRMYKSTLDAVFREIPAEMGDDKLLTFWNSMCDYALNGFKNQHSLMIQQVHRLLAIFPSQEAHIEMDQRADRLADVFAADIEQWRSKRVPQEAFNLWRDRHPTRNTDAETYENLKQYFIERNDLADLSDKLYKPVKSVGVCLV